jgi:hypothetical protein
MKIITFLILLFTLIYSPIFAQPIIEWEKKESFTRKDKLVDFVTLNDGSFVGIGFSSTNNNINSLFSYYYYKFDCSGKLVWRKYLSNYNISDNILVSRIQISNIKENVFAISGAYSKNDTINKLIGFITLIDSSGNIIKSKEFDEGAEAVNIIKTISDGQNNMIIVVNTRSKNGLFQDNKGYDDIWLFKLDVKLNILQKKNIGGEGIDECNSIIKSKDGGYILTGSTYSRTGDFKAPYSNINLSNTRSDAFVLKLDESLEVLWSTAFGGNQSDMADTPIEMTDRTIVVGGMTGSYDGVFSGRPTSFSTDTYIARFGPSGLFSSAKPIGNDRYFGSSVIWFSEILPIDSSNYLLMCYGKTKEGIFNTPNDMTWLLKLNTKNEIVWKKSFGVEPKRGIGFGTRGYQIKKTIDKGYLIVGEADDSITFKENLWLLKLSPLEIEKQAACEGLNLYPNPTIGNIKVQSSNYLQAGTEIKVYDVIGRNIYQGITEKYCKDSEIILPNHLPTGMYYLTINDTKCVLPFVRAN